MLEVFRSITIFDVVDIAIIAFLIYRVLLLIKGTIALRMTLGVIIILIFSSFSTLFGFKATSWVLSNLTGYLFLSIIILFQPEIRRALAIIGDTKVFNKNNSLNLFIIDEIVKAVTVLANKQIGALIVIQREIDLLPYIQVGTTLNSDLNKDILISIFIPHSPLHDGAVIVINGKITYAGTILPLTKRVDLDKKFGTRHRAAMGITEETDAVCIVVSEERGTITVSYRGNFTSELDSDTLRETLHNIFKIDSIKEVHHDAEQ
ncbi:MAG: diadenylate cyclase CdaA [Calditerrivibrio sp.]|nr:diadenylate cyclase CdaA [Calditerrivibrio sp.]